MHTILVAEDDVYLRDAYVTILSAAGYKVEAAENGKVALESINKSVPDALVLDMLMPIMGGLEVLEAITKKHLYSTNKVIAFTNLSDKGTLDALNSYGVGRYLLKSSVMPAQLIDTVKEVVDEARP